jgi:UDP-4-amino-4-deoxy-L-arabinose formyltransferase / UDP-glucuronic acid dehydrogenase (UDP-4-keto-hexauronic acid decarboxylating)
MSPRPVRAVLFGYGQFGCVAFEALQRAGIDLRLVVTYRDRADENCWWQSLERSAQAAGIPLVVDVTLEHGGDAARTIAALAPDLIISSFYRDLVGDHLLSLPRLGAWNLHPSLLPAYRGRAPINWHLVNGEQRGGLTLHRMVRRADAGGIIAQTEVGIDPDQDAYGLTWQLLHRAPAMLDEAFAKLIAGTAVERPQDLAKGSVFGRRRPEDGMIDWNQPARVIHNLVRAVAPPWPGASTTLDGTRLIISRTRVVSDDGQAGVPGTILPGNQVACGRGVLGIVSAARADAWCAMLPSGSVFRHPLEKTP